MEKVSILVPVYNAAKYLTECIESLLVQTHTEIEILLMDDGSTDNSYDICQSYAKKDSRIKFFPLKHGGVSAARNHGIQQSTADYLMFVDADDVLAPTLVETLYFQLVQKQSDLSGCLYAAFKEDVRFAELQKSEIPFEKIQRLTDMGREHFVACYKKNVFSTPVCKLYKKKYISRLFQTEQWLGEDLLFNLHYFKNIDKISYIDEQLYFYRRGIQSTVNSFKKDVFLQLENLQNQVLVLFKELYGEDFDLSIVQETTRWQICYYAMQMFKYEKQSFGDKWKTFKSLYKKYALDKLRASKSDSLNKKVLIYLITHALFKKMMYIL